jgi:hypothetical protein
MKKIANNQYSCKTCKHYAQWLVQYKNFKYCWIKECVLFNCRLSTAHKKCQGKYFDKNRIAKGNMKVVKMIDWEDAEKYPECKEQNNFKGFWNCVKKFLADNNIKFNGSWHQNWEYGVPLIEYDGKLYAFTVSMRRWGLMMVEAFDPTNKDPLAYVGWAFSIPDGEGITVDENTDPFPEMR